MNRHMVGVFAPKAPSVADAAPPPAPEPDNSAVEEARRKEQEAAKRRKGRAATILTTGTGAEGDANVSAKTLLGE